MRVIRKITSLLSFNVCFALLVLVALAATPTASAQRKAIIPEIDIVHQDLVDGEYSFQKIMESGRHLFTTPYTREDGYGEGGAADPNDPSTTLDGPRKELFEQNLQKLADKTGADLEKLRAAMNFPFATNRDFRFLRLNGLDSQSCFECHNTIGSDNLADTASRALTRKPSANGGPAGFASNAFINDDLPYRIFGLIRNPPHVFGTGYAQKLAQEMTIDLVLVRAQAIGEAVLNPGQEIRRELRTGNGVSYGFYKVTYDPPEPLANVAALNRAARDQRSLAPPPGETKLVSGPFMHNFDEVRGVSYDLVVRPFQWKGIASDERNFVRDALNFHFGMFPVEIENSSDEDRDGVFDEVSVGNVSALTIFTMMIRPPAQISPRARVGDVVDGVEIADETQAIEATARLRERAKLGEQLFIAGRDTEGAQVLAENERCAVCHHPTLRLGDSAIVVRTPQRSEAQDLVGNKFTLSASHRSSADLPIFERLNRRLRPPLERRDNQLRMAAPPREAPEAQTRALRNERRQILALEDPSQGYEFDLSLENRTSLRLSYPRLPENEDGSIDVPLFSNLKRHKMGVGLQDSVQQKTDVEGILVAEDEFLTRPLWGVADTGPWLHDGRALSLKQAILLHESAGSEANPVIQAFREKLNSEQQEAVIQFLLTLRLPVDQRYSFEVKP